MTRFSYRLHITAFLFLVMAALQSCHTVKPSVNATVTDAAESVLYTSLTSDYKPWNDIYMPVTLSISSPVEMSISGRATFVRDSEIHLSLRMLGIEVAVVYVNNERLFIIDKFNKRYIEEDLSRLPGDLPVNVSNIQDLLLGRAFLPGYTTLTAADASKFVLSNTSPTAWTLTPVSKVKGADWHFNASRTTPPVLTGISLKLASGVPVECTYIDQRETLAGLLASAMGISASAASKEISVEITWGLGDARWNSGRRVKFSAPGKSYKRVSVDSLVKSFKLN